MKKSLLRLAKLRSTQHRQATLWAARVSADLQATEACAQTLMQAHRRQGGRRAASQWQHDESLLEQLHRTAQRLAVDLQQAQQDVQERAREAKQMEKLVDNARREAAVRRARAEQQTLEAWGRNRQPGLGMLAEGERC